MKRWCAANVLLSLLWILWIWAGFPRIPVLQASPPKSALIVLPVKVSKSLAGSKDVITQLWQHHAEQSVSYRVLSPPPGFENLTKIVKPSSFQALLQQATEKPQYIVAATVNRLGSLYTLQAVAYHFEQGQWRVFKRSPFLKKWKTGDSGEEQLDTWLGELWRKLFPPSTTMTQPTRSTNCEGTYLVNVVAYKVKDKKENGKPWDWGFGRAKLPDVVVKMKIGNNEIVTTKIQDQTAHHFHPFLFTRKVFIIKKSDEVNLKVIDWDYERYEIIGQTAESDVCQILTHNGRYTFRNFGQVEYVIISMKRR